MLVYIDGSCENIFPVENRTMWVVVVDENGNLLTEDYEYGGSNNIAELLAVKKALSYAADNNIKELQIITDSTIAISWCKTPIDKFISRVTKKKKAYNDGDRVINIRQDIDKLKTKVPFTIEWQPRDKNIAGIYIEETTERLDNEEMGW